MTEPERHPWVCHERPLVVTRYDLAIILDGAWRRACRWIQNLTKG